MVIKFYRTMLDVYKSTSVSSLRLMESVCVVSFFTLANSNVHNREAVTL